MSRREQELSGQSKFGFFVGGAGVVLIVAAFIVLALRQQPVQTTVQALPPSNELQRAFTLMIDSLPPGADVIENGRRLGSTPMQLSIENEVARATPRQITVQRPGYLPYSIVQGPSDGNVRIVATLSPEAPQPATPTVVAPPTPPAPTPAVTAQIDDRPTVRVIRRTVNSPRTTLPVIRPNTPSSNGGLDISTER